MSWDEYHRYSTLMSFMEDLAEENDNVELINLGVTLEGREINGLIIGTNARELAEEINEETRATTSSQRRQALTTSKKRRGEPADVQEARDSDSTNTAEREGKQEKNNNNNRRRRRRKMNSNKKKEKQIIFIEAGKWDIGSHAREWIAPAVGTYMAQQAADAGKKLLRHVTIIIVPLANPDGYEFAHTSDRFWRKNRRVNSNSQCAGVDPNRNWDIEWESGIGSSSNPCSEIYQGTEPFSEEETMSLAWVESVLRDRITMFFSIHSFGKFVIFPWGYTTDPSSNFKKLRASAKRITRTLNKQGDFEYIFGQTSTLLSSSAGGSDDYMHDRSVDISFTIELPDNSFILPPERILPVAEQMWAGLLCEIAHVSKNKKERKRRQQTVGPNTLYPWTYVLLLRPTKRSQAIMTLDNPMRLVGRTLVMVVVVTVTVIHSSAAHDIRRVSEPFMYKQHHGNEPVPFPKPEPRTRGSLRELKMTMLVGMCSEDRKVKMTSQTKSKLETRPAEKLNTVDDMKKVLKMEESQNEEEDPLMTTFEQTVADNSTTNVDSKSGFQDRVRKFLSISGIDVVLPLDCGKHPLSVDDPLPGEGKYPWVAALGSHEDGRFHYRCIGVVISNYHILTDADCAKSPNINVVQLNVTTAPGTGTIVNYVAGRRVHPEIRDEADLLSGNNLGVLELALPIEFNDYVQPICLPGQFEEVDSNYRGESTLAGFTVTDSVVGRRASLYNWPESRTLGSSRCYTAIRTFRQSNPDEPTTLDSILTKKHVCVDRPFELVGKSVVLQVDEATNRVQVIGVGGVANAAKSNPIAYTHVQPHRFWVEVVLKKFRDNTAGRS
ncbi:hypothetical protein Pcinc_007887 [Petrolisthes cinctipes]|uniref:Peptidase M14 carboxypeptidase A domain-containing protein n=1 Tax=Petrolisthes cinctipes TaxID=88211 RepID=A0AAE1G9Z4_PETCI|nr:hypothetical protein Pcinc_007887 [Petrolisthes cinctipes]